MSKRTKIEPLQPIICIQEIRTTWTKQSRGGSGAVARNRVPEELPLPEVLTIKDCPTVLYHKQWYKEQEDIFSLCKTDFEVSKTLSFNLNGISIARTDDGLRTYWEYHRDMGAPPRSSKSQAALVLEANQWGRVLYNGRHSPDHYDNSDWWYDRWVFNVGIFWKPTVDVFIASPPVKIFSQIAQLW